MSLFGDFGTAARGLVFLAGSVAVSAGVAWSGFAVDCSELEPSLDCDSADSAALGGAAGWLETGVDEAGVEVSAAGGCFVASVFSGAVGECSSCGVMVCESVGDAGGGSVAVCDDEFVELDGAMIASTRFNASAARV